MQLPEGFAKKYQRLLGPEAEAFLASFQTLPYSGFRANPAKDWPIEASLDHPVAWSQWGYYGKISGQSIDHLSGRLYSQEPSAQAVGEIAAPHPNEWVLDLCAAPGGKSTQLASYLGDTGLLVANEINASRAKVLSANIERWGMTNVLVTNNDPDTLAQAWPEQFDRILVDAPCSGEGMFRKDPEAVRYWNVDYPHQCALRQQKILTAAIKMLAPGGELIYSTCTFSPEEDEQIVAWLLQTSDLKVVPLSPIGGQTTGRPEWANGDPALAGTIRLFPHQVAGEGHFIAKLKKPAGEQAKRRTYLPAKLEAHAQQDLRTFLDTTFNSPLQGQWYRHGDYVSLLPPTIIDFEHVRVVRAGLEVGVFKKNRLEPSHSLATALTASRFEHVLDLDDERFAKYQHGETVTSQESGKGFTLLTYHDKPFAIGKLVNNTVKNYLPKGLRS